jgi:hypothetical protein
MKFAIADPPYLGRAKRWYGKTGLGVGYGIGKADQHPEAEIWDLAETHENLVKHLDANYDGFAIALTHHSLNVYLKHLAIGTASLYRVMAWIKPVSAPSANRIRSAWEPVIIKTPEKRKGYTTKYARISDYLIQSPPKNGFKGEKPEQWTYWVLNAMGYDLDDEIDDLFLGSGAVTKAIKKYKEQLSGDIHLV